MPYVRAASASACAWLPEKIGCLFSDFFRPPALNRVKRTFFLTGAVCHHSPRQFLFAQPGQCVKGPANLEGAGALVAFTFEEELDPGMSWSLALEGGAE